MRTYSASFTHLWARRGTFEGATRPCSPAFRPRVASASYRDEAFFISCGRSVSGDLDCIPYRLVFLRVIRVKLVLIEVAPARIRRVVASAVAAPWGVIADHVAVSIPFGGRSNTVLATLAKGVVVLLGVRPCAQGAKLNVRWALEIRVSP